MEFSRQQYWSGLPFPSPGDLPDPGIKPGSPALWADALLSEPPGKPPYRTISSCLIFHVLMSPWQVKERLQKLGPSQPMTIFLRQEIDRMQRVLTLVRSTLTELKLAIDGTIIMSENLRDALNCMFDARIPARWKKVCLSQLLSCLITLLL